VSVQEQVSLFEQEIYESMERCGIDRLPRLWVDMDMAVDVDVEADVDEGGDCTFASRLKGSKKSTFRIKASFTKKSAG
jgi:hypothetical protein